MSWGSGEMRSEGSLSCSILTAVVGRSAQLHEDAYGENMCLLLPSRNVLSLFT